MEQTTDTRTRRNNISRKQRYEAFEAWRGTLNVSKTGPKVKQKTQREKIEEEVKLIFASLSDKRALYSNAIKEGRKVIDLINPNVKHGTGYNKKEN